MNPWELYARGAEAHPLLMDCANSLVLWTAGDCAAQKIEGLKGIHLRRLVCTALWATLFIAPFGHYWYLGLEAAVSLLLAEGSPLFVLAKVVLDLGIFCVIHVLGFFTYLTLAEGGTWEDVRTKARTDFWPTYLVECAFWSVFQSFNFALVPVAYQLLAVNVATLFDSTFLCYVRSRADWAAGLKRRLGLGGDKAGKGRAGGGDSNVVGAAKWQRLASGNSELEQGLQSPLLAEQSPGRDATLLAAPAPSQGQEQRGGG